MQSKILHNRVDAIEINNRVDAEYYTKEFMSNEHVLQKLARENFEDLVDKAQKNCIADFTSNGGFEYLSTIKFSDLGQMPFLRTQNIGDNTIIRDDLIFVAKESEEKLKKSICKHGDLLVCRTGTLGLATTLPKELEPSNINQNITRFILNRSLIDPDYCAAFLNSRQGRLSFVREATGVIQKWINNEKLRKIKIVIPNLRAQTYIGDKVRWAERLRGRSRCLLDEAKILLNDLLNGKTNETQLVISNLEKGQTTNRQETQQTNKKWIRRVSETELDLRIDCQFYNPAAKAEIEKVQKFGSHPLSKFVVHKCSEPPIHTDHYAEEGIHIISPANFSDFTIDLTDTNKLNPNHINLFKDFLLQEGDLIFALVGDVGHACIVTQPVPIAITYRRTAHLKLQGINPFFVCAFLNDSAGDLQLKRMTTGVIQAQLRLEDSVEVLIPSFKPETQDWIGDRVKLSIQMREHSETLTNAAKLLVEALIEGKLNEDDLKAAQQGLEQDDTTCDRDILTRLSRKGIDHSNEPPLFPNLDDLYTALSQLEEAETTEAGVTNNGQAANVYTLHEQLAFPLASETASGSYPTTQEVLG
ncbi:restriction endonuclease subunit S [Kovacikia minuta CCNUW1]|uniref:restriction endonuclease subunit S n=1 Tax=Kovacikia minuta TaxID=2931930 RepID=UPI001CCFC6D1|nr:restriction endonuclease subunit S [Kovacikia minuta]UBF28813.1 restriction endonuclease subunit S [Kovacikia minuta CCNUW1]